MAQVCREPGCWHFVPCERHPLPDRRSPSSKVTGTHRWRTLKARVLRRDGYRCHYCGGRAVTADHVKPVALFPHLAWDEGNLVASCKPCNDRKGGRLKT
jgi:5-methylcytosine-specific restriction endonuclease McrA